MFGWGPHLGFDEKDLARLWMWIGFHGGPRALRLAIAVTTGKGRKKYSAEELDAAELFVEMARIPMGKKPRLTLRLNARLQVERGGLHPSAYHNLRRRKPSGAAGPVEPRDKPIPTSAPTCPEQTDEPTPTPTPEQYEEHLDAIMSLVLGKLGLEGC